MGYFFADSIIKGKTNKLRGCARHGLGYGKMKTQKMVKMAVVAMTAVAALISANDVKAQYYLDYGPGSLV